ncbi:hypothetical protein chiPu_0030196, partial [Chiloscyllium punctatum]|nr:hypothetical protein [Chiloscyllium punctatum]
AQGKSRRRPGLSVVPVQRCRAGDDRTARIPALQDRDRAEDRRGLPLHQAHTSQFHWQGLERPAGQVLRGRRRRGSRLCIAEQMMGGISYSPQTLRRDVIAGLTVAAISLPQAMAYALLAGVDPRYGLYSAILITAVASVFGSSSHLINGPTSAISLVVFSALSIFDADQRIEAAEAMFLLAALVGTIQIAIAVLRLGDLTRYISESVILGFMSAAALLLALGQISNALGVRDKGTGAQHILSRLWLTLATGDTINMK